MRLSLQDMATRDFVRSELRDMLDELQEGNGTDEASLRARIRAELEDEVRQEVTQQVRAELAGQKDA